LSFETLHFIIIKQYIVVSCTTRLGIIACW